MTKLNNDGWEDASITEEGENISSIRIRLLEHKVDRKEIMMWNLGIVGGVAGIVTLLLTNLGGSIKESNNLLRTQVLEQTQKLDKQDQKIDKQDQKLHKQDEALDKQKDLIHELDLEIKLLNERLKK
jgi:hypothetical protein